MRQLRCAFVVVATVVLPNSYMYMWLNGALLFCCNSQDAAKREAVEESGFQMEMMALIAVEFNHTHWMRFTFAGISMF